MGRVKAAYGLNGWRDTHNDIIRKNNYDLEKLNFLLKTERWIIQGDRYVDSGRMTYIGMAAGWSRDQSKAVSYHL